MEKKTAKCVLIQRESPKTRSMDRTPNTLAKELGVATNTVKNRLKETGINFEMARSSAYQMYNYEGLPILRAYLGAERFTAAPRNDLACFMPRLEKYLDDHSEQSFCRKFLYAQKPFQNYLINAHLGGLIRTQLQCIERLSHQLILEANLSYNSPDGLEEHLSKFPGILDRLNRIIFELSNFTDFNQSTETEKASDSEDKNPTKNVGGNKLGDVDRLVSEWYTAIQGKREQLYKAGANQETIELTVSREDEESKAAALNEQLLSKTLLDEQDKIKQMESILKKTYVYQDDFKSVYGRNKEAIQTDIRKLMQNNIDAYLEKMFRRPTAPEFKLTEELHLPQVIVGLVREWFYEATTYAYDLQVFCSIKSIYYHDIIVRIKEIWSIMESVDYISKVNGMENIVALAIDESKIAARCFKTHQYKESLIRLILNPSGPDKDQFLVSMAAAVTVEYFYQRHAAAYSQYHTNLYMQYLETLEKIEEEKG